jgi:hypothetical protein
MKNVRVPYLTQKYGTSKKIWPPEKKISYFEPSETINKLISFVVLCFVLKIANFF